jgi:PAS domain S-box-containing protein
MAEARGNPVDVSRRYGRKELTPWRSLFMAFGAFLLLILLGFAYSLGVLYTLRREATRENLAANLAQAESAAGFIADHQNGILNLLALIASRQSLHQALATGERQALLGFLQPLADMGRQVAAAWLADPTGRLLVCLPVGWAPVGHELGDPADRADKHVSGVHVSQGGERLITIRTTVTRPGGEQPLAILGIMQPAAYWEDFFGRLAARPGRSFFLFDQHGQLVATGMEKATEPVQALKALAEGLSRSAGQAPRALIPGGAAQGPRVFAATAPVPDTGWTVVVLHEYEAATASTRALFGNLVLFLGLLLLSVFFVGVLLYQRYRTQQRLLWNLDEQAHRLETQVRARTADLEATTGRYRDLVEDLPDVVYELDQDDRFTFVSRAVEQVLGYRPDQMLGKRHRDFVLDLDQAKYDESKAGLAPGQFMSILALRHRAAGGDHRWLSVHSRGVFDRQGRFLGRRGVAYDVTSLILAERRIHELSGQLINAQEEERRRLALDLHDETGQVLSALKIGLQSFQRAHPGDSDELNRLIQLTQKAMDRTRALAYNLRPAILDSFGLVAALEDLCDSMTDSGMLKVDYSLDEVDESRFFPRVKTTLFRFVQEALTNVAKHSGSERAEVRLTGSGRRVVVEVRDFGRGFDAGAALDPAGAGKRLGLLGMRERLDLIGGRLSIESAPGETVLRAEVDLGETP